VRLALALWWRDSTAEALGAGAGGKTVPILEAPSINQIDHQQLRPGDLAVTRTGTHILAYLGEQTWIQADPGEGRVLTLVAPEKDNLWFRAPVRVMRWAVLTR
jgi:cell wall-associated NlpC family hydrolase